MANIELLIGQFFLRICSLAYMKLILRSPSVVVLLHGGTVRSSPAHVSGPGRSRNFWGISGEFIRK
jgi:hypothetical protein